MFRKNELHAYSFMLRISHTTCLLLLFFASGCERSRPQLDSDSREYWIRYFSAAGTMEPQAGYPASIPVREGKLGDKLKSAGNEKFPPYMLGAILWPATDSDQRGLTIGYYSEEPIVSTVRIREYDSQDNLILCEDYEIYPEGKGAGKWLDGISLDFSPRRENDIKDSQAWRTYRNAGIINREMLPTIWISLPSAERRVLISLVDTKGRETNSVPLEHSTYGK